MSIKFTFIFKVQKMGSAVKWQLFNQMRALVICFSGAKTLGLQIFFKTNRKKGTTFIILIWNF